MKHKRWIFFGASIIYNLILGFSLKDFLVLSPTLEVFYLLSFLPTFFLLVEVKSKAMCTVIFVLRKTDGRMCLIWNMKSRSETFRL